MVLIPGGSFIMGDKNGENDEKEHRAEVATFCLDRTEVTVGAYAGCVNGKGCTRDGLNESTWCNFAKTDREDHPINCVDWTQANTYCRKVGKRLPTEQEWEYAARGGAKRLKYPWGHSEPNSSNACWNRWDQGSCKVGTYPAEAFGLFDMAGNVWEWVQDYYGPYPTVGSKNYAKVSGSSRVCRGGSWDVGSPSGLRGSDRDYVAPSGRVVSLGFRCARTTGG